MWRLAPGIWQNYPMFEYTLQHAWGSPDGNDQAWLGRYVTHMRLRCTVQ